MQTAEHIVSRFGYDLNIYKDNRIREKEFGIFHGIDPKEVRRRHPEEYDCRMRDGPYWHRPLGGENYVDVEQRLYCFLDKLVRDYHGKEVLVITHQVPYKMIRALYEHLDEDGVLSLEKTPCCAIQEYHVDTTKMTCGLMKLVEYDKVVYDRATTKV